MTAITFVAAAVGGAAFFQFAATLVTSSMVSVSVFCLLILAHLGFSRRLRSDRVQSEIDRLQTEISTLRKPRADQALARSLSSLSIDGPQPVQLQEPSLRVPPVVAAPPPLPDAPLNAAPVRAGQVPPQTNPPSQATATAAPANKPADLGPVMAPLNAEDRSPTEEKLAPLPLEEEMSPATDARDLQGAQPPLLPETPANGQAPAKVAHAASETRASDARGVHDVDMDKVEGLVKRLADQVNEMELRAQQSQDDLPKDGLSGAQETSSAASAPEISGGVSGVAKDLADVAIHASVSALNETADLMRSPPSPAIDVQPVDFSDTPEQQPQKDRATIVMQLADALNAGRVDVWLSPIHGLSDHAAHHYEVQLSLRTPAGEVIDTSRLPDGLRGTSIVGALDTSLFVRTAQIGHRLAARDQTENLFSELHGEVLDQIDFLKTFATTYQARKALSHQLVIVLRQRDVRELTAHAWATLNDMRELGFRFAMSTVTDLDMDFAQLRSAGFSYVKLSAGAFLNGLPALGTQISAGNVCQHLADAGMTLVVDGIATEVERAKIFGFGVIYGQGEVFGGRRAVRRKQQGQDAPTKQNGQPDRTLGRGIAAA